MVARPVQVGEEALPRQPSAQWEVVGEEEVGTAGQKGERALGEQEGVGSTLGAE